MGGQRHAGAFHPVFSQPGRDKIAVTCRKIKFLPGMDDAAAALQEQQAIETLLPAAQVDLRLHIQPLHFKMLANEQRRKRISLRLFA